MDLSSRQIQTRSTFTNITMALTLWNFGDDECGSIMNVDVFPVEMKANQILLPRFDGELDKPGLASPKNLARLMVNDNGSMEVRVSIPPPPLHESAMTRFKGVE